MHFHQNTTDRSFSLICPALTSTNNGTYFSLKQYGLILATINHDCTLSRTLHHKIFTDLSKKSKHTLSRYWLRHTDALSTWIFSRGTPAKNAAIAVNIPITWTERLIYYLNPCFLWQHFVLLSLRSKCLSNFSLPETFQRNLLHH